jgi:catechol 2,3-dioxygenase-like lactoylglutathione lyase family enzyme
VIDPAKPAPQIAGIHHFTIRCARAELDALLAFYRDVLGMRTGARPAFDFPGHWMYVGDVAIVHLAAIAPVAGTAPAVPGSGFDHVSLHSKGLRATRDRLEALGIPYEELPVPGWPLQQIFLRDPVGSKIELTFDVPE